MKRIQLPDTFLDFWGKMRNSSFPWIGLNTHKSDLQKLNAVKSTLLSHFRNRITIGLFGYKFANTRGQWREKYLFDTREGQKRLQRSTPMQVCGSELSCDCNKVQTLERERERERTRENERERGTEGVACTKGEGQVPASKKAHPSTLLPWASGLSEGSRLSTAVVVEAASVHHPLDSTERKWISLLLLGD